MGKTRSEPATRADLKFEKKLQFYAKVRDTVTSLSAQKAISKKKKHRSRQKKLKAYDLSSLSELNLVLKEGNQLRTVLNHTAFHSDPLAAIHQHLQSTQPIVDEKPEKKKNKSGKKVKRKKPKASPGRQSMEI
ncbi:hypothetical protein F0562_020721 [Nyssa sinensis]|uniref:Ribosome biogenesis protein slx9-like n=1 Tax=Nyssa sinensis TaxID=561372 RepID=A0A5J5BSJ9_9ASTE|nr:hypothetical protein F0562_020721 [Nyssa sinensis]